VNDTNRLDFVRRYLQYYNAWDEKKKIQTRVWRDCLTFDPNKQTSHGITRKIHGGEGEGALQTEY